MSEGLFWLSVIVVVLMFALRPLLYSPQQPPEGDLDERPGMDGPQWERPEGAE